MSCDAMFRTAILCLACSAAVAIAQEALPAARVGDATASGGTVVTGDSSVLINRRPAARQADLTTNPSIQGTVPGIGGIIRANGQAGASDRIVTGSSNVVIGSNVIIGGQQAATVAPSSKPANKPKSASQISDASAKSARAIGHFFGEQIAKAFAFLHTSQKPNR